MKMLHNRVRGLSPTLPADWSALSPAGEHIGGKVQSIGQQKARRHLGDDDGRAGQAQMQQVGRPPGGENAGE